MAPRKRKPATVSGDEAVGATSAMEKIARLLALVVTKDMDTDAAALKLDAIGFEAREISMLLGVGPNFVNVARYRNKKGRAKRARG